MFKNLFSNKKTKSIFLVLPVINFESEDEYFDILKTHSVSKETALKFDEFRELIFKDEKLTKMFDYENQEKHNRILLKNEKNLTFRKFKEHTFSNIIPSENGINQLGGTPPPEISFINNSNVKFQYLGFISPRNKYLDYLTSPLHLFVPVYTDFTKFYLDYSKENVISILDIDDELEEIEYLYEELEENAENVIYKTLKFNFQESDELGEIGHSGIPLWVQYPEIPKCPKTNETMNFIVQLNSGPEITSSPENFSEENLEFGGGNGNLYVFYSPKSNIACYLFQGS